MTSTVRLNPSIVLEPDLHWKVQRLWISVMCDTSSTGGHASDASPQVPVARLEYTCSRDGRLQKGATRFRLVPFPVLLTNLCEASYPSMRTTYSRLEEIQDQSRSKLWSLDRILSSFCSNFSIQSDHDSIISRNHCEIYTVVYEPGVNFIYVRDRKSFNGTFVNSILIGKGPHISAGYLLEDGDTIEILPYWKFRVRQDNGPPRIDLDKIQFAESRVSFVLHLNVGCQPYSSSLQTSTR